MTKRDRRMSPPTRLKAKTLAVCAMAALAALTLAVPASGMPVGDGVRAGKNISVFGNLDFVAAFGYPVGEKLTIDVYRGDKRVATAFGPAVSTPEGGGLEVNHGVEGNVVQGDCWENFTPDVRPGDRIVVTDASGGTDQVLVDNITMGEPREDLTTEDPTDVIVEGTASYADGRPIDVADLDSAELRLGSDYRATPNSIARIDGTESGWRATYKAPYDALRNRGLSVAEQTQAILDGDHAMGYGHVAPLPAETQMVEGLGTGGPAPGCAEAAPDAPASAMGITSPKLITRGNQDGNVEVGGVIQDGVNVALQLNGAEAPAAEVDRANGTWSARIPAAGFREGVNEVRATFTGPDAPAQPQTANVRKDTQAPGAATAVPKPGLYNADQSVTLGVSEPGARILYTTGGGAPDRPYEGQEIRITSNTTIKTVTVDSVGNAGEVTPLTYEIDKAAPEAPTASLGTGSFDAAQRITFGSNAADLEKIRYTTDGSAPTAGSGAVYAPGAQIAVPRTTTFKAVAVDRAGNVSQVLTRTITIRTPTRTTLGMATTNLKLGRSRLIQGAVGPNQAGGSVLLTIDRPGALPTVSRRLPLDAFSRYAFSYRPTAVGFYRVSVAFGKDVDSLGSASGTRVFRVVR